MYRRAQYDVLTSRIREPRRFMQVVVGPRQIGKTTLVKDVLQHGGIPYLFQSADNVPATQDGWIADVWQTARLQMKAGALTDFLLVIDEVQKIQNWSEAVKKEWDSDTFNDVPLKVVLLGSSRVMLERGLSESLAGRFEEIRMTHWSYAEMHEAFGMSLDDYICYGGYPGAAALIGDVDRWEQYIGSAIVEATINKDILLNTPIGKPALLRQTFELGAAYSGQILSLTKMLGQLNDAGNTTTLAGYLNTLADSGLLCGLQKYANDAARRRASIPKLQVYNNALYSIYNNGRDRKSDAREWGRCVESAVGAYIVAQAFVERYEVFYWREGNEEVDFVLRKKGQCVAIEVKTNNGSVTAGLTAFRNRFHPHGSLIVGPAGMPIEQFLSISPSVLLA